MEKNPTDILIEALEELGYVNGDTIFLHGCMPDDKPYPISFWTFRNYDNEDKTFRDNKPMQTDWTYSLNFYTSDFQIIDLEMKKAKEQLQKKGFIVKGKGSDALSDEKSHIGKENTVIFIENNID